MQRIGAAEVALMIDEKREETHRQQSVEREIVGLNKALYKHNGHSQSASRIPTEKKQFDDFDIYIYFRYEFS